MSHDGAAVRFPPPLIFVGCFLAGLLLGRWLPHLPVSVMTIRAGAIVVLLAAGLLLWGFTVMLKAKTAIVPHHSTTTIVTSGPFAFTRNPLYLGLSILYLGVALWFGSTGALVLLPVAVLLITYFVIQREEEYLSTKFGEQYEAYRKRVRRWF